MGERLIKPYEISVWEDRLTQDGDEKKFVEKKLAVIGSNTMAGLNKVYDPVFNKKANGEKTLSFSLRYKYFDPYTGNEGVVNPFVSLLINERKIKLHYNNEWYEFIVKDHVESSDGLEWTYTCTDAFVLELAKNGYNLTFDSELNNNQGTAEELAKKALKNTDWKLGGAEVGKQLIAEPIYKASLVSTSGIDIINVNGNSDTIPSVPVSIYVFYSYIKNQSGKFVQFIIRDDNRQYIIDDNNVITDTNFRITTDLVFNNNRFENQSGVPVITLGEIENHYQANRLAYGQLTTYDPIMERTVDRFVAGDREIYRYIDYVYTTSNVITNLITNGDNFNILEDGSLQGWNPYNDFIGSSIKKLEILTKPELGTGIPLADLSTLSQIEGFVKVHFNNKITAQDGKLYNTLYNSGINDNVSTIGSISAGDQFVFRWRAREEASFVPTTALRALVAEYTQDAPTRFGNYYKHIRENDVVLQFEGTPQELNNIIEGGTLQNNDTEYVINQVVQTPSTKYIYISNNAEYVWDTTSKKFVSRTPENYAPYYYVTGTATKTVTNKNLLDSSKKYGIFIYSIADDIDTNYGRDYFIQDIQITRFVADANNNPLLIGNVPTADSKPTEYYYIKPADNAQADEIETYATTAELKAAYNISEDVVPVYNNNSEKILSITAAQSNCFDILQTIAETFECWIDLKVLHNPQTGEILYDEDGNPEKYVYLKEYAGDKNWAGFKYGINLQSIERTINSDEIVTKLIVDQSQSDYVDEGYISIANSSSNTSGESYILNFDYYYNQGLLNREEVETDRLDFITEIGEINKELQTKEKRRIELEASLLELGSNRNIFTELITSAQDAKTLALEDFEALTGRTYENYREAEADAIKYENKFYILTADTEIISDKDYYTYNSSTGVMTLVESPQVSALNTYYEILDDLTEEETILETIAELYSNSAVINNYSGILTNVEKEYWGVRKLLRGSENYKVKIWTGKDTNQIRHVYVELNDYLPGFSFTIGQSSPYISTTSRKYFDLETNATTINFTAPTNYTITPAQYTIVDGATVTFKITSNQTFYGIEDDIEELREEKDKIIKAFNNKYGRFIQEGTWSSTDYIDAELYYLDALQVSNTSSQPTVSYTINVVEISELEGFEWYSFDAGDKSYVEDTEFFGWANINGVLTPAQEEVVVSEVEWHLEEPDKNVITVQNYKTRFEDFFQRISATVQTVQYNEATYAKISSLLDANGTINQDVLLESLNNISGRQYSLTSNGSVVINDDVILVQNLTNPANRVIINSEGIRVSSDGGNTWTTAIDGQGINIGTVYTGTLNTNEVIIGSSDNPSFRWDKAGISAYKSGQDGVYDLQTYVRYDQYGLYGIKEGGSFKAQNLQDVLDKAHFAVTWDGFFIKNSYTGGGKVQITSDNDFQVLQSGGNEKIKIGALEWTQNGVVTTESIPGVAPSLYGIRINNDAGDTVLKTGDDGNLTITGVINAQAGNFSGIVQVGNGNPFINIDGANALIGTSNYSSNSGWMINAEGDAVFNNITARGTIKTAVFEYAEIEAVGGMFIFRPSSTIKSAYRDGNDIIVQVEKPFLFAKISYNEVTNPTGNPKVQGWYERTNYGYKVTDDTTVDISKTYYTQVITPHSWAKISNYTNDGTEPNVSDILTTNGLTHVYEISDVDFVTKEVTLKNAAATNAFIDSVKQPGETEAEVLLRLEGGALIDMGRKSNDSSYDNGIHNYGIGINSSDNTVNLPSRAISLFETVIDETRSPKVSYEYRGILGTLPPSGAGITVNNNIYQYMQGTQGIYTDNMYIGDDNQYLAFYTDGNNNKRLKINASEIVYDIVEGQEVSWEEHIDSEIDDATPILVEISSNIGNLILRTDTIVTLTCTVRKGNRDITSQVSTFTWSKMDRSGNIDPDWSAPTSGNQITVAASDIHAKAIFICEVTL